MTSNTLFMVGGGGGGCDHYFRVSDLLLNVHDTEYQSSLSQITILETSKYVSDPSLLPVAYKSFDCIPYLG